jgi:hypothetical protein
MLIQNLKCVIGHFYNSKTIFLCLTKFETGHLKNFDDASKQYLSTYQSVFTVQNSIIFLSHRYPQNSIF